MNSSQNLTLARASYDANVRKDRPAIEALLAEDFHFTSPLDNRLDRATYFQRCWPNSTQIDDFRFIHLVAEGDHVFITYEGRSGDHRFRNTEVMTMRDGRILEVEVYFGWSLPHPAPSGGFLEDETPSRAAPASSNG